MRGSILGLPNMISISRIPLSIAACWFIWFDKIYASAVFIILAMLTDVFDGWIARVTDSVSDWGKILDPLADKISIAAFIIVLLLKKLVPFWFVCSVISRDLLIALGGFLLIGKMDSPPSSNFWGKLSSMLLSIYLARQALKILPVEVILWNVDPFGIFVFCVVMMSFFVYLFKFIRIFKIKKQAVKA